MINKLKTSTSHFISVAFVTFLTLGIVSVAYASPWPYAPGTILDPACLPTDSTCTVATSTASLTAANIFTNTNTFNGALTVNSSLTANAGITASALSLGSLSGLLLGTNGVVSAVSTSSLNINTDNLVQGNTNKFYADSLVNTYVNGSSTIAKLYTANTWNALQTFGNNISLGGAQLNMGALAYGNLMSYNGTNWVNAATSTLNLSIPLASTTGTLAVSNGGTGATTFGQGWIFSNGGTGALSASTSPTVAYITATSTTATSTFSGGLTVGNNAAFVVNQLANANSLYVAPNGYIGIGTSSPQGILDVVGSSNSILPDFTGARAMSVINTDMTNGNMAGFDFRTNDTHGVLTTGAKILSIFTSHASGAVSSDLAFRLNNAGVINEAMRITSAGNVGIGTTTPARLLDIAGTGGTQSQFLLESTLAAANNHYWGLTAASDGEFKIASLTNALATTTRLAIDSSGNVSLGKASTSPMADLSISGNNSTYGLAVYAADASGASNPGAGIILQTGGGLGAIGAASNGGTLTLASGLGGFAVNSGQSGKGGAINITAGNGGNPINASVAGAGGTVTINPGNPGTGGTTYGNVNLATNGGNVGIGTTSPLSTLTVTGSGCFSKGAGATVNCGTTAGSIYYNVANTNTYDIAEDYVASDLSIGAGDIIAFDPSNHLHIVRASGYLRPVGVVSTDPGIVMGGADATMQGSSTRPVALAGRIPTKVNLEGGPIAIGDSIALSSVSGVGKKASGNGDVIGIALEPYTSSSGTDLIDVFVNLRQNIDLNQLSQNVATTTQSISDLSSYVTQLLTSVSATDATVTTLSSQMNTISSTTAQSLSSDQSFIQIIATAVQNLIQSAGNWAVNQITATLGIFDKVQTNTLQTKELCVDDTCITSDQLKQLLKNENVAATAAVPLKISSIEATSSAEASITSQDTAATTTAATTTAATTTAATTTAATTTVADPAVSTSTPDLTDTSNDTTASSTPSSDSTSASASSDSTSTQP